MTYRFLLTGLGDLFTNGRTTVPLRTTGRRFAILVVNKSYRRYTVGRTTSVVAYVRQTLVNRSGIGFFDYSIRSSNAM